jgi:hypothetical protein
VGTTRKNANVALITVFMHKMVTVCGFFRWSLVERFALRQLLGFLSWVAFGRLIEAFLWIYTWLEIGLTDQRIGSRVVLAEPGGTAPA